MGKETTNTKVEQDVSISKKIVKLLTNNIREYMMYIVLVAIFLFFNYQTYGMFVGADNITNIINQSGYVAVLAIGMTLILILKHIDLSVGYVAGFSAAVVAILVVKQGINPWLTILIVLAIGLLIGIYHGVLVTWLGIPAFVTTLASMFIFRGLLTVSLKDTGTIKIQDKAFNNISNGTIPDILNGGNIHLLTLVIGIISVLLVIFFQFRARRNKLKYNFKVTSTPLFIAKLVLISVVIMAVIYTLSAAEGSRGLPWTAVVVGVVLFIYDFMLNKTQLGRYIYGIGGNDQASELSGVNVKKVTMFAFCSMSVLSALSGILCASRFQSAYPTMGLGFEMDAIASAYIGGVAVTGGVGKVTNTIIGTLVIVSLTNGLTLMGVDSSVQYIIKGFIFVIAVAFDVITRAKAK